MSYNIETSGRFDREIKKLIKKFPSLKNEFASLIEQLEKKPALGTDLGHNCFKIRISIASKDRGKSGGARVITHVYFTGKTVYLLTIYDKSEQETVTEKEILQLIESIK